MGLNSFFKIFLPKDKIFFTLFDEMADTVHTMAGLLHQLVNETDVDKRASIASQIEISSQFSKYCMSGFIIFVF